MGLITTDLSCKTEEVEQKETYFSHEVCQTACQVLIEFVMKIGLIYFCYTVILNINIMIDKMILYKHFFFKDSDLFN